MVRHPSTAFQGAQKVDADVSSVSTGKGQPRVEQQVCLHLFHWFLYVDIFSVGPSMHVERRRQSITSLEEAHDAVENAATRRRSISMSATLGKTNLKDSITSSPSLHEHTIWTSRSDYAYDIRLLYKRRLTTSIFLSQTYVHMSRSTILAFAKLSRNTAKSLTQSPRCR